MPGQTDLSVLLRSLSPRLNDGAYVFAIVPDAIPEGADPVAFVREDEGLSLVVPRRRADELGLSYDFVAAWITLQVDSALDAVGMTAVFSRALADAGISANVVAGYTHDHLFVPHDRADDAMRAIAALATDG
jgi:hypothetical protein